MHLAPERTLIKRSGENSDVLGPRNAFFRFLRTLERRSDAFQLTFTTACRAEACLTDRQAVRQTDGHTTSLLLSRLAVPKLENNCPMRVPGCTNGAHSRCTKPGRVKRNLCSHLYVLSIILRNVLHGRGNELNLTVHCFVL